MNLQILVVRGDFYLMRFWTDVAQQGQLTEAVTKCDRMISRTEKWDMAMCANLFHQHNARRLKSLGTFSAGPMKQSLATKRGCQVEMTVKVKCHSPEMSREWKDARREDFNTEETSHIHIFTEEPERMDMTAHNIR